MDDQYKLDEKIKEKFKLFQGIRSQEEDQKMFDRISDLCFDEMIVFLGENLSDSERDQVTLDLEATSFDDEKTEVLKKNLAKIENVGVKIQQRMDYFLDKLLLSSVSEKLN